MKRIAIYSLLLLFAMEMSGQSVKEFTFQFNKSDFSLIKDGEYVHISPKLNDFIIEGDTLEPALPYIGINILISPSEEYKSMVEEFSEIMILSNAIIEPNPKQLPTNTSPLPAKTTSVKYEKPIYPIKGIQYTGTHLMDGYKYLSFVLCPFRYDAINKKLFLKESIKIKIQLNKQNNSVTGGHEETNKYVGNNMRKMVQRLVYNSNELNTIYPYSSHNSKSSEAPYKYVIVTCDSLRHVFEELAHWKTIKGVRTKVVTVEDCYDEYPNLSPQLAIKTVLSNNYANGMEYALLAGDVDIVPSQYCVLPLTTSDTSETPTDLFYACFDNCFSWDANGNQIYGETNDNIDLYPEFILTRVSVSSSLDANIFVNRIIEYESSPNLDGWTNNILSCGNILYVIQDSISDAQKQGEDVYHNAVQPYWNGLWFRLFDTYTDYPEGSNYNVTWEAFQSEFEKGYTFIDEYSHGWTNNWGHLEGGSVYWVNKADSLINRGYSIITTIACYTNAFDKISDSTYLPHPYYTCLSETFMRNPNSGIIAYFGSSREGWSGTSHYFNEKFYEGLFGDSIHNPYKQFGFASTYAKNSFICYPQNDYHYNYYQWLIKTINPLGDPEMPVFTATPLPFTYINVVFSNGNLNVSTGVSDCRICVSSAADNGESYYEVVENTDNLSLSGINEDCYLCISKAGYIPYVARVGNAVYLQDETFISNLDIFSTTTDAGRDVTISKPEGPVTIEKGKVTNYSNGTVTIKNSFEVKVGAEFEIKTNQ